jgi:hypothetical protein
MDDFQSSTLKTDVLLYLTKHTNNREELELLYDDLKPEDVTIEVFTSYVEDMETDGVIEFWKTKDSATLILTNRGKRILREGGYMIGYMKRIVKELQSDIHDLKERTKLDMEIKDLINRLKDYKWTRIRSWIAISISVAAVVISILVLIFK